MAEDRPENIDTAEPSSSADDGDSSDDVVGGLESLLEEEGAGLDLPDEDLSDLFDEGEGGDAAASPMSPPPPSAPRVAPSRDRVAKRRDQRRRDDDEYRALKASLLATPLGVQVDDDGMTARVTRITVENSPEEILRILTQHRVVYGIDKDAIAAALTKAGTGQVQYEIAVARGRRPKVLVPAHIKYYLPDDLITEPEQENTPFDRLKRVLEGEHVEACKSWNGTTQLVRKGDVLAELVAAELEPGCDVYGETVNIEDSAGLVLQAGDNASLSEDGTKVTADIYGYAGLIAGVPTVLGPIWVSADHMEARFIYHAPKGPPQVPTEDELRELLEMMWIEYGVLDRQLELICLRLEQREALPRALSLAQGSPEVPGKDAQIRYAFDPFELMKGNQFESLLKLPRPEAVVRSLQDLYANPATDPSGGIRFKAVKPGEVVVERIPATAGVVGKDIQGEEVVPEEGNDVPLEVGAGLVTDDDGLRCTAEFFGYVTMRFDIETNIRSALWLPPDGSAAYFLNLPQGPNPRYPSVEDMDQLVEIAEITEGYSSEKWAEILAELEAGSRTTDYLICVAQGTPAIPGVDATFDWAVMIEARKPGRIMEDGSIDFRDRGVTTAVKEGDLLGKLMPPKAGEAGMNIHGVELQPPPPLSIEVITDSRIYAEPEEDGSMSFYCESGGGILPSEEIKSAKGKSHKRINISVYPISNIDGDVDYSTGNIDFNGDVVIGGSVQSQFSVKATGSVTIEGYIEAGATVTAGQDLLVQRGVLGSTTELVAGGHIMAKFIQEATVRAGGDVKVGSYVFNASVRAGGEVLVPGMGEGKSRALVGGLIWGAQGISARSIGSPYNTSTRLVVGVDPDGVNRSDQILANIRACEEKQTKLLESLGVATLDLDLLKQKLAHCGSPQQKQAMLVSMKRVAKIAELEKNQQEELAQIAESQRELSHRISIQVGNQLYAGVELRIGELTQTIYEDTERVSFRLLTKDEQTRIQEEPLTGTPNYG